MAHDLPAPTPTRLAATILAWRGPLPAPPRPGRWGVAGPTSGGYGASVAMTSWYGEFTDDYFAQPAADPAAFGIPTEDDGSRDEPLLSDRSWAVSSYRPDVDALAAAPTRIVIAVGEVSLGTFTGRTAVATAELLGQQATVFPSHHGGEHGYAGQPEAFARKLRVVLGEG